VWQAERRKTRCDRYYGRQDIINAAMGLLTLSTVLNKKTIRNYVVRLKRGVIRVVDPYPHFSGFNDLDLDSGSGSFGIKIKKKFTLITKRLEIVQISTGTGSIFLL
jgi:hypothetical protein